MTIPPAPDRLFGLPRRMSRETMGSTIGELRHRFERQYGRPLGAVDADLEAMRDLLFNPVAREERVRTTIADLAEKDGSGPPPDHISELLLLPAVDVWLVTPEARVAIPVLEQSLTESLEDWCYVDDVDIHAAEHLVLEHTRTWARHRLYRTIELQAGTGAPMLPVAIAIPLLLIVNGNIGSDKALRQPKEPADQRALDQALVTPVRRFGEAAAAGISEFSDRHLALYNGYALSEARRRLGNDLRLDRLEPDQHHVRKALYIAEGRDEEVLDFLTRQLRARELPAEVVGRAYGDLVSAYMDARPTLAAFGIVHEDPTRTKAVGQRLVDAMT
jgi:hypothetical protein